MTINAHFVAAFALLSLLLPEAVYSYSAVQTTNRVTSSRLISRKLHSIHHILHAQASSTSNHNIHTRVKAAKIIPTIHQPILNILGKVTQCIRYVCKICAPLLLSIAFLLSSTVQQSNASSSSSLMEAPPSSSYYLQNNPQYSVPKQQAEKVVSIQSKSNGSDYMIIKQRTNCYVSRKKKQSVKRISLLVLLVTFAASSFRASLRKQRIVRSVSPFGRIRNASALGNGVSVIRVCIALGFDDATNDDGDNGSSVDTLMRRLKMEENELHNKMILLSQLKAGGQLDANRLKQKALGDYLSSVSSVFLQNNRYMRLGSLDSMRVPFVEEAARALREGVKEERSTFDKAKQRMQKQSTKKENQSRFVLVTILLAIKGDHTPISLPFGIIRRRDVTLQLSRIVEDVTDNSDCLVNSEVMTIPDIKSATCDHTLSLTEEGILQAFPDLVTLT